MEGSVSLALLNLPPNTVLSLDGCGTQTLRKEEELVVITDLPPGFRLLSIRAGAVNKESHVGTNMSMSIGLTMLLPREENVDITSSPSDAYKKNLIVRKYDNQTEEIASNPPDDITCKNLYEAIQQQRQNEQTNQIQLIPYQTFTRNLNVDLNTAAVNVEESINWNSVLTNFISQKVLKNHNLSGRGDKIIPGSMDLTDEEESKIKIKYDDKQNEDGIYMKYKPIPCFDTAQDQDRGKVKPQNHKGTKKYIASLPPPARTAIFTRQYGDVYNGKSLGDFIFQSLLDNYYEGQWEVLVGEIQLSFVVFVCCSCLASLEHWRDSIYMLSLVESASIVSQNTLFTTLMSTLKHQLSNFDCSIFHDDDFVGGNVLVPAIKRIVSKCKDVAAENIRIPYMSTMNEIAKDLSEFISASFLDQDNMQNGSLEIMHEERNFDYNDSSGEDEDDEDGPVVVPMEEVQASIERSAAIRLRALPTTQNESSSILDNHKQKYPFLFSAVSDGEDVLMACARILDEQGDVTLVREAAAYLEEVEAKGI